jgi:hypothetical protein
MKTFYTYILTFTQEGATLLNTMNYVYLIQHTHTHIHTHTHAGGVGGKRGGGDRGEK